MFTRSGGIEPTPEHLAWWTDNGCQFPASEDHTYFVLTEALPLDVIRQHATSRVVNALEAYGADNFSYAVTGTGYQGDGYGSFNADRGQYDMSIFDGLVRDGYLPAGEALREPLSRDGFDSNGLRVYRCLDRVAVFSLSESITPFSDDSAWWADNNCPTTGLAGGRSYFNLSDPLPLDVARQTAVLAVITAFESYATEQGTFVIPGAGFNGDGGGWFTGASNNYDPNVADALVTAGYLQADAIPEDPRRQVNAPDGLRVEHCGDRVGVFALSNGAQPTPEDAAWWANNNCTLMSIDDHNHTYFQLSRTVEEVAPVLTEDQLRVQAVSQTISALESYGAQHLTYTVTGAGENGTGEGWYQLHNGTDYPASIVDALVAGGHFGDAEPLTDPLYTPSEPGHDFILQTCGNRVAVFSQSNDLQPYGDDVGWWTANNCDPAPLSTHPYFRLSSPLDVLDEPYVVVYSAAAIAGMKKATVRAQPQNGPVGFVYASVALSNPNGSSTADNDIGCHIDGICLKETGGNAHLITFNEDGLTEPFDVGFYLMQDDQEVEVELASVETEELAEGSGPALDETERLMRIHGFNPAEGSESAPEWDTYEGLSNADNTGLDRCDYDARIHNWNFSDTYLELPEDSEMYTSGLGLAWSWDFVENSRECYDWNSWATYKNGVRVSGSMVRWRDSGRIANITTAQLDAATAELCLEVTPVTWVDGGDVNTNYISPSSNLYDNDLDVPDFFKKCVPAPRNWGGHECDAEPNLTDHVLIGPAHDELDAAGCFNEFLLDVNGDDVFDRLDMAIILACLHGSSIDTVIAEGHRKNLDCDLFNLDLEELSKGEVPIEQPAVDKVSVEVPESSNDEPVDVKLTIGGNEIDARLFRTPGETIDFDIPPDTTGEVCIVTIETGEGADTRPSRSCLDYFTLNSPTCGSLEIPVTVKNNSPDDTRIYTVAVTGIAGTETEVVIDPDATEQVVVAVPELGDYEITVTTDGQQIAHRQTATPADCATLNDPTCDGTISAHVWNIKNEPSRFELVARNTSGAVIETAVTQQAMPAKTAGTIEVNNLTHGTYTVTVTLLNNELVADAIIEVGAGCNESPEVGDFRLIGEDPWGDGDTFSPYEIEIEDLQDWDEYLEQQVLGGGRYSGLEQWHIFLAIVRSRLIEATRPAAGYGFYELRNDRLGLVSTGPRHYFWNPDEVSEDYAQALADAETYVLALRNAVAADFAQVVDRAGDTNNTNSSQTTRNIRSLRAILGLTGINGQVQASAADFAGLGLGPSVFDDAVARHQLLTSVIQFTTPVDIGPDPFQSARASEDESTRLYETSELLLNDLLENYDMLRTFSTVVEVLVDETPTTSQEHLSFDNLVRLADFQPEDRSPYYYQPWGEYDVLPFEKLDEFAAAQTLANKLVEDPVAFNMIADVASTGSAMVRGELTIDKSAARGRISQDDLDFFKYAIWIEPYLRPYIDDIDQFRDERPDGTISIRDFTDYLISDPVELPEFLRLEIIKSMDSLADRTALDIVHQILQAVSVVVSILILGSGGIATPLGQTLFALALTIGAAEGLTSILLDDDTGAIFALAGVLFDSLDVAALATRGLKNAAADATNFRLGTAGIQGGEALADLPDDVSHIMGDILAAGRYIENPTLTLNLSDAVGVDAASAIRAVDPGDPIEQGLAAAIVAHTKGTDLDTIFTNLDPTQTRELAGSLLQGQIQKLPQQGQDSFRALTAAFEATSDEDLIEFTDHLISAMTKGWNAADITVEEMLALRRAVVQNSTLSDAQIIEHYNQGRRFDPDRPTTFINVTGRPRVPAQRLPVFDGGPDLFDFDDVPLGQARDDIEAGILARNNSRAAGTFVSSQSELLGEKLAQAGLELRYTGATPNLIDIVRTSNGNDTFDAIYEVVTDLGETRLVIVEAKGAATTGPGYSTRIIDGLDVQQGHPDYMLDILAEMKARTGTVDVAALDKIELAVQTGTLDYMLVVGRHLNDIDSTAIHFTQFVLPSDTAMLSTLRA